MFSSSNGKPSQDRFGATASVTKHIVGHLPQSGAEALFRPWTGLLPGGSFRWRVQAPTSENGWDGKVCGAPVHQRDTTEQLFESVRVATPRSANTLSSKAYRLQSQLREGSRNSLIYDRPLCRYFQVSSSPRRGRTFRGTGRSFPRSARTLPSRTSAPSDPSPTNTDVWAEGGCQYTWSRGEQPRLFLAEQPARRGPSCGGGLLAPPCPILLARADKATGASERSERSSRRLHYPRRAGTIRPPSDQRLRNPTD